MASDKTTGIDQVFEIARKISQKYNARYPEKVQNIVTWQEHLKSLGVPFQVDHTRPFPQFIFVHEKDDDAKKRKQAKAQQDYILSGAFLAAAMTGTAMTIENGVRRVIAKHQGINIEYTKSKEDEKFSASGLRGNLRDARAQNDEAYLNNTLLETVKTAFLLVQNAKLAGYESITFGNTSDPCRRYALKLACDALGVDCAGEKIDPSHLPKFNCLGNRSSEERIQFYAAEYLNFPNDAPRFAAPEKEELKVEAEKTDDPKTWRFIIKGLSVDYGDVDIDRAKASVEVAEQIADGASNPLVKDWLKNPFLVRMSYRHGEKAIAELTLSDQKDWDGAASTALPSKFTKSFAETFRAGLEMKLKNLVKVNGTGQQSLFDTECAIAYAIEQHNVQEAVRGHRGYLQFDSYDPDAKKVVIDLGGSCNDTCQLIGNTTGYVEKALMTSFPRDVKKVLFQEIILPKP